MEAEMLRYPPLRVVYSRLIGVAAGALSLLIARIAAGTDPVRFGLQLFARSPAPEWPYWQFAICVMALFAFVAFFAKLRYWKGLYSALSVTLAGALFGLLIISVSRLMQAADVPQIRANFAGVF